MNECKLSIKILKLQQINRKKQRLNNFELIIVYNFVYQLMFSFLSSLGASSNFQKHRLILTAKSYEAPDQTSMKKIIQTFRGEDEETRSQIAFATIIKKIHISDSSENWVYLLKNLIIFDRVIEENCFLEQISTLNLKPIENYTQKNQAAIALNSQNILKSFWKLIQFKSSLLSQKQYQKANFLQIPSFIDAKSKRENSFTKISNSSTQQKQRKRIQSVNISKNRTAYDTQRSILSVARSQKQQFLKTLNVQQICRQSLQLENLFEHIFKVIASIEFGSPKKKHKKSLAITQTQKLIDDRTASNTSKDLNILPNLQSKNSQQNSSLYENLIHSSSRPDVIPANTGYNQKYKSAREEFFNSKLVNYLHLQLLYKLLSVYSNQLICIQMFVSHLLQQSGHVGSIDLIEILRNSKNIQIQTMTQKEVNLWRKIISNYLIFSGKIINYVENHKTIKGFEVINYQELCPFQNENIIGLLEDFIQNKNTLQEPDMVKVQELGMIMDVNNHIKVERKAQCSYEKALTARKMIFPSRNFKDKNNPFLNWHNGYSANFPPKEVLTIDLIMEMRQNPLNPATQASYQDDEEEQSIYQPFIVNRHSCIYNLRESTISSVSDFEFISLDEMKKKDEQRLQSAVSRKTKNFYYFKPSQKDREFKNVYSSLSKQSGNVWAR